MLKTYNEEGQGSVDVIVSMVFGLLLVAVTLGIYELGLGSARGLVVTCGAAALVTVAAYGFSNYYVPISKLESTVYVIITKIGLGGVLLWVSPVTYEISIPMVS